MAGLYVHIPFCKSRCIYCGFYSTVMLDKAELYVDALCREMRIGEWDDKSISTIYFGGGTPSQLSIMQLRKIMEYVTYIYKVSAKAEITIEVNPDDAEVEYLRELRAIGFNRLSMGVQTFDDERLRFLHRRHSSSQAVRAVENARLAGFESISIDLMFGFPGQTLEAWKEDVDRAIALSVQHMSAYSLMYEEGTHLCNLLERGEIEEISDELSLQMYEYLIDVLSEAGYEHYEISNWAKPGCRSRHNSSYWQGIPYLGLGAGAHSYDGSRRWSNPDSLTSYIDGIQSGASVREYESLDTDQKYDEFVMTGLRTCDGVDLATLSTLFGDDYLRYCLANAKPHISSGKLLHRDNRILLSREGLFVSNDIMSDLMKV